MARRCEREEEWVYSNSVGLTGDEVSARQKRSGDKCALADVSDGTIRKQLKRGRTVARARGGVAVFVHAHRKLQRRDGFAGNAPRAGESHQD